MLSHTPELVPCLGGLVDVTLVQRALVACLLAQGLMELELQDKTHKVPEGTGWVLRGLGRAPGPGTTQLSTGQRVDGATWGEGRTKPGSGARPTRIPGKNVGTSPGHGVGPRRQEEREGSERGTELDGAMVPDVRCHMWDVILRSGIKVGFISDNWSTDALVLDSRRKWFNCLRT